MADEITNGMLLNHMQLMKGHLEEQIGVLQSQIMALDRKMDKGFEEARQHRQALQEDLEATMRMLAKHDKKLVKL